MYIKETVEDTSQGSCRCKGTGDKAGGTVETG